MPEMSVLLFVLVGLGVMALVVRYSMNLERQTRLDWQRLAQTLGLDMTGLGWTETPRIRGVHKGVRVLAEREVRGSGKNRQVYTRVSGLFSRPLSPGLNVSIEGMGDQIAKLLGGQDIQLGIPEADRQLRVKGDDPRTARLLFRDDGIRSAAVAFLQTYRGAQVQSMQVSLQERGLVRNAARLHMLLDAVADTVGAIEAHRAMLEGGKASAGPRAPAETPVRPRRADGGAGDPRRPEARVQVLEAEPLPPPVPGVRTPSPVAEPRRPVGEAVAVETPVSAAVPPLLPAPAVPASTLAEPPGSPGVEVGDLGRLLAARPDEREGVAKGLRGRQVQVDLEVERVSWTMGFDIPKALQDGRTLVGRQGDLQVAVRFPAARNAEIDALARGTPWQGRAVVASWDGFYRQLLLDAGGAP